MAEADDGARGERRIVNAGIDVDAQRHMVVTANVLQMPATVPERVVEAPVLPEVPDRRQVPPAVTAVGFGVPKLRPAAHNLPICRRNRIYAPHDLRLIPLRREAIGAPPAGLGTRLTDACPWRIA